MAKALVPPALAPCEVLSAGGVATLRARHRTGPRGEKGRNSDARSWEPRSTSRVIRRNRAGHRADQSKIVRACVRRQSAATTRTTMSNAASSLRASMRSTELAKLRRSGGPERPRDRLDSRLSHGGRPRIVPLWWDARTLDDLAAWKVLRLRHDADFDEPFLGR